MLIWNYLRNFAAEMKIFFYHTEDIQYIFNGWEKGSFPGHLLYGATHFKDHGIV